MKNHTFNWDETKSDHENFMENGFTKPYKMLDDETLALLQKYVDGLNIKPNYDFAKLIDDNLIVQRLIDSGITELARKVLSHDDLNLWAYHVYIKPPHTVEPLEWHTDTMSWRIRYEQGNTGFLKKDEMTTITAWIALDDVSTENGTLIVLPRSHDKQYTLSDFYANANYIQENNIKTHPIEIFGGYGIFFHEELVHASPINNSDKRRTSLVLRYSPKHILNEHKAIKNIE